MKILQKTNLSILAVIGIILGGSLFQWRYDRYAEERKAIIRRNFREIKGAEIIPGCLDTIFFDVRKCRSLKEVDEKSRRLIHDIQYK